MLATVAALHLWVAAGSHHAPPASVDRPQAIASAAVRAAPPRRAPSLPQLWVVPYDVAVAQARLGALALWPPPPTSAELTLLVPEPVPQVVSVATQQFSDAFEEDSCLGWHARSRLNARTRGLRWLTVDQAAVASLHPGHCNGTIGVDLAGLARP